MSLTLAQIAATAGESENQAEDTEGFVRKLPRAGSALLRLRDYVEFGMFANKNPA